MQSSYVVPSQLLIGYLDGKHRKIGQAISTNQFSQELTTQERQLLKSNTSSSRLLAEGSSKAQEALNSAERNGREEDAKTKRDAYFADVALLETILARLKLSAEARKALKNAEDSQGRISARSLSRILGEYQPESGTVSDGAISSEEVRDLLASLQYGSASGSTGAAAIDGLKQQGSYSLAEFREIVDELDRQSSATGSKNVRGKSSGAGRSTSSSTGSSTGSSGGTTGSSVETATAQVDCPPSSAVPPFARQDAAGTSNGKTDSREVKAQDATKREGISGQDTPGENRPSENAEPGQEVNKPASADESEKSAEGVDPQAESASSSRKVSSNASQSTDASSGSQSDNGTTSAKDLSILAQMNGTVASSTPSAAANQAPASNENIMSGLNQQTALAGMGSDNGAAGRASGDKRTSMDSATAETGNASGSTPADTSIAPPPQAGRSSLQSGNEGGGSSQTSSSNSELDSANGNAKGFLWSATQTAQNGLSNSSSGQAVSANSLASSTLIRDEIAKNGIVTGEIHLGESGESADSAVSSTSAQVSKEMDLALSKDLGGSSSSKASNETNLKPNKAQEEALAGVEGDKFSSAFSSMDAIELRTDNGLNGLPISRTGTASSAASTGASEGQLNMSASSWTSELAERIQSLYQQNRTSNLTLDLEPEGMGHLTLRVSTRKQEVTAFISTDTQQAGELLSRNSNLLRSNIESMGLTLTNLFVDVRQGKEGSSNNFFQNSRSGGHKTTPVATIQEGSVQKTSSASVLAGIDSERLINLVA